MNFIPSKGSYKPKTESKVPKSSQWSFNYSDAVFSQNEKK